MRLHLIEGDTVIARELQLRWAAHGSTVHSCRTLTEADAALDGGGAASIPLAQRAELIGRANCAGGADNITVAPYRHLNMAGV